jgi:archaellum component FlaF (FlaF/FlaG flagellin family)
VGDLGQSTIVAAAFSAMIILVGVIAIVSTSISSIEKISGALEQQIGLSVDKFYEECSIDSVIAANSTNFRFNVTNTGQTSIVVSEIDKIDVFVTINSGREIVKHIGFNQSGTGSEYWRVSRVFFKNALGDKINPLDVDALVGSWDPLEVLEIDCRITTTPINSIDYVSVVMPNGFKTSGNSASAAKMGVATITGGDTSVTVYHIMGALPRNIQLTPMNQTLSQYWVSDVNQITFTIKIAQPQTGTLGFYWVAH